MKQFFLLVKREWMINRRDLVIYVSVIALLHVGIEIFESVLARSTGSVFNPESYGKFFPFFLFFGGVFLIADYIGSDLYKKERQHTYLMLPATNLAKYLSKSLLLTIVYPIALTIFFILLSAVIEPILYLAFGNPIHLFNPFQINGFTLILIKYWALSSIFVFTATFFRKASIVKTFLALTVISLLSTGFLLLFVRLFITLRFGGGMPFFDTIARIDRLDYERIITVAENWQRVTSIVGYLIVPLALQVIGYWRLCEVEATDAL
ncbi:MAG: hypothetical protein WC954_04795 [Sphaerochaeta sp.]